MEVWTTYLIGGGGLSAIGLLAWRLYALLIKSLGEENRRLDARLAKCEAETELMRLRAWKAEERTSELLASNTLVSAELALALKNITRLTLQLSTSGGTPP